MTNEERIHHLRRELLKLKFHLELHNEELSERKIQLNINSEIAHVNGIHQASSDWLCELADASYRAKGDSK